MIIEGYLYNPFPFEIGDIVRDKEDGDTAKLVDVHWHHATLQYLTGSLAANGGIYTHRTERMEEDFEKVSDSASEKQSIQAGDMARVTVEGKFHGQEVKLLAVKPKKPKTIISLDVDGDERPRPS